MTVDEIRELINLAAETGIAELEVQRGETASASARSFRGPQVFAVAPVPATPPPPPPSEAPKDKGHDSRPTPT